MYPQPSGYWYPAYPPPQPAPAPKKKHRFLFIGLAILIVSVLIGGALAWFGWTPGGKNVAQMSYISANDPGPSPFTDSVADVELNRVANVSRQARSGEVSGDAMELYGGSGNEAVCNQEALISNLYNLPGPRAAFAAALGLSDAQVDSYIRSLKPVVLMHDTWVTNHSYANGRAVPFQAVLQAGTAVLIDAYGVPRVKCGCGNPLAEPWQGYVVPSAVTPWVGYDYTKVIYIYAPQEYNTTINITDIYNEGDSYNITFKQSDIVVPEKPELAPQPAEMNVRPDEKLLRAAGVEPAPRDEWDVDYENRTSISPSRAVASGSESSKKSSADKGTNKATIDSITLMLPTGTREGTFDPGTATFEEGEIYITTVNRDTYGKKTDARFTYRWEIKDTSGKVVQYDQSLSPSSMPLVINPSHSIKPGSYSIQATVRTDGSKKIVKSNTLRFKVVNNLDDESSGSSDASSNSSASKESSTRSTTESATPTTSSGYGSSSGTTEPVAPAEPSSSSGGSYGTGSSGGSYDTGSSSSGDGSLTSPGGSSGSY